ncbi:DUF6160 family protein [Isoalcanivorax beigongshangi]|uniref:DUF6160 family protein n=1 Tax=Isoalcanivorax beigongshangi TaxID=3238810 RepID=A0ABV4AHS4_9GAMM
MKAFRKLALVSAIAALPVAGQAMQALDDTALSGVTGQDGLVINLNIDQTLNLLIEDTTGLNGVTTSLVADNAGGILISGMHIKGDVALDVDTAANQAGGVLRLGINVTGLELETGDIRIVDMGRAADSSHQAADAALATAAFGDTSTPILDSMTINMSSLGLEVQLGAAAENLVAITDGNVGNITINNFGLNDAGGGGKLGVGEIKIANLDITGTSISINDGAGSNPEGLTIGLNGSVGLVSLDKVSLGASGTAASIGNVYVGGLTLNGTNITVAGK